MAPRSAPSAEAIEQLRAAAAELSVEEVLDLCFAFNDDPLRLTVYLDVLRSKGSASSQAAACIICFDLAMQGVDRFEKDFLALVPVMREFLQPGPGQARAIDPLIGESQYLRDLVDTMAKRLTLLDPRIEELSADELIIEDEEVFELDIFEEDELDVDMADLLDLLDDTDQAMYAAWDDALNSFLLGSNKSDGPAGFYADDKHQLRSVRELREQAESLADKVPAAAQMRPIVELFLGAHLRAKNLFGRRNQERDHHVVAGLRAFAELDQPPAHAVAWLTDPTVTPFAWEKVAELLLDFTAFVGAQPPGARDAASLASAYLESGRPQPPPPRLLPKGAPRRRR